MQVGTLAVQHLLEKDVLYLVPLYQRPYVWTQTDQWEPLWSDIQRLADAILQKQQPRAHFLGATVQDRAETAPGQIETRLLIDGQQRITTLQLLLKAFGDAVKKSGNERYAQAIEKLSRNNHPLSTLEVFLQYVLTLLTKDDVAAGHLYSAYTEYAASPNAGSALDRLGHFKRYGSVYEKLQTRQDNPKIQLFMERLNAMDVTTAFPFLLTLFDRYGEEEDVLLPVLRHVESFLVRRMICRLSTRGYNRMFVALTDTLDGPKGKLAARLGERLLEGTAEFDRWPSEEEFSAAWMSNPVYEILSRPRMRMILEAMEMGLRNKFAETGDVPRNLTIEHIMPQTWEAFWSLPADQGASDEAKSHRERLIHTIGNLTLLNSSLNPLQSNKAWVDIADPKNEKRASLRANSTLFLNKEVGDLPEWGESQIESRSARLFELAKQTWPLA